jgi:hypothetical protein
VSAAARPATPRTRIEEAKARFTIPTLARMFGAQGELGKSCRVSEDGLRFIDFRTGQRGDAVDYLAKIKGISNAEAWLELLKLAEGTMPEPTAPAQGPEAKTPNQPLLPGLEPKGGTAR